MLSPPPPVTDDTLRRRLIKIFLALIIFSLVTTPYIVSKTLALLFGICFFSGPLLDDHLLYWLDLNKCASLSPFPTPLTPRSTLLYDVPTHAQLTLHLLRSAERHGTPIPPPPLIRSSPPTTPIPLSPSVLSSPGADRPFGASPPDILSAAAPDPALVAHAGGHDSEIVRPTTDGSHRSSRATEAMRHGLKAVVKLGVAVDKVKARAGNAHAKARQGTLEEPGERAVPDAERFDARYEGRKGFVYLTGGAEGGEPARVSFVSGPPLAKPGLGVGSSGQGESRVVWSLEVASFVALVKHSGYGPTVVNSKTMRYVVFPWGGEVLGLPYGRVVVLGWRSLERGFADAGAVLGLRGGRSRMDWRWWMPRGSRGR